VKLTEGLTDDEVEDSLLERKPGLHQVHRRHRRRITDLQGGLVLLAGDKSESSQI
jgi:hypothetical protein